MNKNAIHYQILENLGNTSSLMVFYDFNSGSVFTAQSGSVHQSYLQNTNPSQNSGNWCGKIVGASGASAAAAKLLATGSEKFILNNSGDFTKNYLEISGSANFPVGSSSYIFSIEPDLSKDSVIFGCLDKIEESIAGEEYLSSKGFNFGISSRGHLFLNSISEDGHYCFVANQIELSQKNVIGLNFSNGSAKIHRFDYLNNNVQSQQFDVNTSHIKNNRAYIGFSNYSHKPSGQKRIAERWTRF
jgi:hypothetical protein